MKTEQEEDVERKKEKTKKERGKIHEGSGIEE
jgi:hypothetical protein